MAEEGEKDAENPPSLLESIPPTDADVLKALEDVRLTNKHYAAIGMVAAQWAYFEAVIDTWLHSFANVTTEVGVCFTGQLLGPRSRIDAFIALVRHSGCAPSWNAKLDAFAQNTTGLAEQRNRAVHDVWMLDDPAKPVRVEASARKKLRIVPVSVSTDDLRQLMINIRQHQRRFDEMATSIFNEIHGLKEPT
jgi:hypothetical protein